MSFVDGDQPKSLKLNEASKLVINCSAIGNPTPAYSWDRVDQNFPIMFNNKWMSKKFFSKFDIKSDLG